MISTAIHSLGWTSLRAFNVYEKIPMACLFMPILLPPFPSVDDPAWKYSLKTINHYAGIVNAFTNVGLIPSSFPTSLTLLLTEIGNTALAGFIAMQSGFQLWKTVLAQQNCFGAAKRAAAALALNGIGSLGIWTSIKAVSNLFHGVQQYFSLDSMQRVFATKQSAYEFLSPEDKSCRAIIFNNLSVNSWVDWLLTRQRDLIALSIYRNCVTQSYDLSDDTICNAIDKAREHFQNPVDLIYMLAHGNSGGMQLGKESFTGSVSDVRCIDSILSPNGQLILGGCNTATTLDGNKRDSLAHKVANALPGRHIIGFAATLRLLLVSSYFNKNRISAQAFSLTDENSNFVFQCAREITVPITAKDSPEIKEKLASSEGGQTNSQNPEPPPETGKSSENPRNGKPHNVLHKMFVVQSAILAALALAVYHVPTKRDKVVKKANGTKDMAKTKKQGDTATPSPKQPILTPQR